MTGRVLQLDLAAHKVADVLLPWFVNGTLEGDELAFVQRHVSRCGRCQREVEWLRGLHAACVASENSAAAAPAPRRLRSQLEEPPPSRSRRAASPGQLWVAARPWSRWAVAASLAVIVAAGVGLLSAPDAPALYRTLGAENARAATGSLVVVFDPTTTEADLRRILREVGARIVDGPSAANAYVLEVPAQQRDQALQALRAQRAAQLVEPLGPQEPR